MKTKELANVLIKVFGLTVIVHSIPNIITGMFGLAQSIRLGPMNGAWFYPASSFLMTGIGIFLIVKSRKLTELMFKNEDE